MDLAGHFGENAVDFKAPNLGSLSKFNPALRNYFNFGRLAEGLNTMNRGSSPPLTKA